MTHAKVTMMVGPREKINLRKTDDVWTGGDCLRFAISSAWYTAQFES